MTEYEALQVVANGLKLPIEHVASLGLRPADQLLPLAFAIIDHPLLNPPGLREKEITFKCACCGVKVRTTYVTSRPKYCSKTCRQKAYRRRQREAFEQAVVEQRGEPAGLVRKANGGFRVMRDSAA